MTPREGEPVNRTHIRKDLVGAAQRIAQHAKHLSAEEIRELDEIADQLSRIHADDVACENLRKRYSDLPAPPWGTRYAFWWQRAWWWIERRWRNR